MWSKTVAVNKEAVKDHVSYWLSNRKILLNKTLLIWMMFTFKLNKKLIMYNTSKNDKLFKNRDRFTITNKSSVVRLKNTCNSNLFL